ncbi:RQC domain-containing protein, partial [Limosilactobacillus pontis]
YFGQECEPCGHCSNCTDDRQLEDITAMAQAVIAVVKELHGRFGKSLVAKVVTGSHDQRINQLHADQLEHYGALKLSQQAAGALVDYLLATGYLELDGGQYPVVKVAKPGWRVLDGEATVQRRSEPQPTRSSTTVDETPEQAALFELLRKQRRKLADDQGVPPFMIFSDRTLHDMVRLQPQTPADFLTVNGVGQAKLKKYGQIMMDEIGAYLSGNTD